MRRRAEGRPVLRLIGIVISIAAADAVNPSTLIPGLYIASGQDAVGRVGRFCAGVLGAELGIGLILILGPGELILDLVPEPSPHVVDWLQLSAGVLLLLAAPLVWRFRDVLGRRSAAGSDRAGGAGPKAGEKPERPTWLLGAGIVTVGMPTNVAYLGGLTTIVGSDRDLASQVLLLFIYDAIFILPLAAVVGVLAFLPGQSERLLGALRRFLDERLVALLVAVLAVAGAFVLTLGISGLTGS